MPITLSQDELHQALKGLPGWSYKEDQIAKTYQFDDFKQALAFINRIGDSAEQANHHPEIFNVYNKVTLHLSTHDAGNKVTQKDIDLAKAIDAV